MRQTANSVLQDPTEPRSLPYHASMFPGSSPDDPFMIALQNADEENAMKRMGWIGTALLLTWTAYGQERLAIVGATIVDGNGGAPIASGTIIIDGERIGAVGRSDTAVPSDARVIDGSGKFVTPGFIDTNVHLSLYGGHTPERYETLVRYHDRQEDVVLEASQLHLKVGVTTVRDSYGVLPPLITVRDKIARGDEVGSRMLVAGNIVGWGGPFSMQARSRTSRTYGS